MTPLKIDQLREDDWHIWGYGRSHYPQIYPSLLLEIFSVESSVFGYLLIDCCSTGLVPYLDDRNDLISSCLKAGQMS